MATEENLPPDLNEEVLSYVPPKSLARFRVVSKQWNALLNNKTFLNNHKATFRFILTTKSKIYSVSFDPKILVLELTLDTPGLGSQIPKSVVDCNEFILCGMETGSLIWNPWLQQSRWIQQDLNQSQMQIHGVAHDNKGGHKIIVSSEENVAFRLFSIDEFASDALKNHESESYSSQKTVSLHNSKGASLNGNFYWITFDEKTDLVYHITTINSTRDRFLRFCDLPCGTTDLDKDALVLRSFEGDRLSLLKQCHATKKIETWVTKNKIDHNEVVEWVKFMEVSSPDLPDLVDNIFNSQPSYFIEDKRLVVCSCDQTGRAWIYVFCGDKFISKTHIVSVVDPWPSHCTFIPPLVPVPRD